MTWFDTLMGFPEKSSGNIREKIIINGDRMRSIVNQREYVCGSFETPSLFELRSRLPKVTKPGSRLKLIELVADVQSLHRNPQNTGAVFQVASQFNTLEMASPSYAPEDGVGIYEQDHTQGPACAIAAGAGTIFRNYFVTVNGKQGQSFDNQIDCLKDIGEFLGNIKQGIWQMRSGYAFASIAGLQLEPSRKGYRC